MNNETDPHDLGAMRTWISSRFRVVMEVENVTNVQYEGHGYIAHMTGWLSRAHCAARGFAMVGDTGIFHG